MTRKKENEPNENTEPTEEQPVQNPEIPEGASAEPGDELEALRAESNDLLNRLQRVSADYMNYQKRVQRDITQAKTFANEQLMKELLGVIDDMERALDAARANNNENDPLMKGMQMVHDNFLQVLGKFGLEKIEAEGQPFDPEMHSALMQQPTDEVPPQTVVQVAQNGYRLKDRTIRPASVIVSTSPEAE